MGEWYEKIDRLLTILVVAGTAVLTVAIIWEAVSRTTLLTIAVFVAIVSWGSAALDFGKLSQKHYSAGDEYHSLYEDFRDYYVLELENNGGSAESKFSDLVQRRRRIKDKTPRTTNFWHNRLDSDDINKSVEKDLNIN